MTLIDDLSLKIIIKESVKLSINPSLIGINAEIASVGHHDQGSNPSPSPPRVYEFSIVCISSI
jgi:hypothetical protein